MGAFGALALLLAIAGPFIRPRFLVRPSEKVSSRNFRYAATAAILTVVIYVAAHLRLPDQAGYLLPIVPAILLLLLLFVPRPILQISCACLILAPFLEFSRAGFAPGAIFADREERPRVMTSIRNFLFFAEALPGHNAFVVGAWEPQIAVMTPQLLRGRNRYFYLMNASEVKSARDDGRAIFYLPAIREFNLRVNGLDLAQCGGQDLHAIYERMLSARTPP